MIFPFKNLFSQKKTPKELIQKWVEIFNTANAPAIAELYQEDAINYQVMNEPLIGKVTILGMFATEFAKAKMVCLIENIFENREWAILEWKDPLGL